MYNTSNDSSGDCGSILCGCDLLRRDGLFYRADIRTTVLSAQGNHRRSRFFHPPFAERDVYELSKASLSCSAR